MADLPSKNCTLYILRHGETTWNTQHLLQGVSDSPLTEDGISQAVSAAEDFRPEQFAAVFSSDLLRAKRTAEIIALEHDLAVKSTELLRERNFGEYEGKHVAIFRQELNERAKNLTAEERHHLKLVADMESDAEVISRLITFLRETAVAYPGEKVLLVTHSGVIRILLLHLGYVTQSELDQLKIHNLAYVKLESDGSDFFIRETHQIEKQES